ncbi:MAG: hypothetical protein JW786_12025, partial [Desulfobacterales bacterium]|nr:hypothetical protein [Desulfobacterales bacterium]
LKIKMPRNQQYQLRGVAGTGGRSSAFYIFVLWKYKSSGSKSKYRISCIFGGRGWCSIYG